MSQNIIHQLWFKFTWSDYFHNKYVLQKYEFLKPRFEVEFLKLYAGMTSDTNDKWSRWENLKRRVGDVLPRDDTLLRVRANE